jgi:phage tail-like protein
MKPVECRRQLFRSPSQWEHGVSYRLQKLDAGGFALFSRPAFAGWVTRADSARDANSLAVDHCGRVFWVDGHCDLDRYDPINELIEAMIPVAICGQDSSRRAGRMISARSRLWILDHAGSRVIAMRPDTFQIVTAIPLSGPIDVSFGAGRLVTLDGDGIGVYDLRGRRLGGPYSDRLQHPRAVGADPKGQWIYVVDADSRGFLRYATGDGTFNGTIGRFDQAGRDFRPRLFVVHRDGNLLVSDGSPVVHEFATDGGYIGSTGDVGPLSAILSMTVGTNGEVLVGSPEGIARFSRESGAAGNKGLFYSRTLDNGTERDESWHRLDLVADLDEGGALDVYYASTDDAGLARAVSGIFDREASAPDKVGSIEAVLGDRWKGPHQLRDVVQTVSSSSSTASQRLVAQLSHSVLFRPDTKRYLWLKLELVGLSPRAHASVRELRLYYPRLSYLRYLPAVYQQDPVSQEFLERYLQMFDTIFSGLEATIERIPEVFDPELTPGPFLDWLAQWLDLGIEEDWPAAVKRRLIANASRLYQLKGTPGGLAEFIEVVTGRRAVIREAFDVERPFVLGNGAPLGVDSRIFRRPVTELQADQRTVLGHGSILGTSRIRATTHAAVNPFHATAHRFTVLLDLSRQQYQRFERGLHRILRDNSPAHVGYEIRLVSGAGLGPNMVLGVNFRVEDLQPLCLGYSTLGRSICASPVWYGPELGIDTALAGPSAPGLRDGER